MNLSKFNKILECEKYKYFLDPRDPDKLKVLTDMKNLLISLSEQNVEINKILDTPMCDLLLEYEDNKSFNLNENKLLLEVYIEKKKELNILDNFTIIEEGDKVVDRLSDMIFW